ncbi:MAG: signal peptidase II [Rickettsiales bacterium]|jgi:signal peptidase II|nr:signal peptidase II [Rickettsiales bacterium]
MKKILGILTIVIGAALLDQATKGLFLYLLTGSVPLYGNAWDLVPVPYMMAQITDFFNIVFTWNPGSSFSLFRSVGEAAPMIIVVITGIIIGFLAHYLFARAKSNERWPLALIIGGALGNLIDRIRFGAVIDFLDFHVNGWHWPAFNVADICICAGVGLYLILLFVKKRNKNE